MSLFDGANGLSLRGYTLVARGNYETRREERCPSRGRSTLRDTDRKPSFTHHRSNSSKELSYLTPGGAMLGAPPKSLHPFATTAAPPHVLHHRAETFGNEIPFMDNFPRVTLDLRPPAGEKCDGYSPSEKKKSSAYVPKDISVGEELERQREIANRAIQESEEQYRQIMSRIKGNTPPTSGQMQRYPPSSVTTSPSSNFPGVPLSMVATTSPSHSSVRSQKSALESEPLTWKEPVTAVSIVTKQKRQSSARPTRPTFTTTITTSDAPGLNSTSSPPSSTRQHSANTTTSDRPPTSGRRSKSRSGSGSGKRKKKSKKPSPSPEGGNLIGRKNSESGLGKSKNGPKTPPSAKQQHATADALGSPWDKVTSSRDSSLFGAITSPSNSSDFSKFQAKKDYLEKVLDNTIEITSVASSQLPSYRCSSSQGTPRSSRRQTSASPRPPPEKEKSKTPSLREAERYLFNPTSTPSPQFATPSLQPSVNLSLSLSSALKQADEALRLADPLPPPPNNNKTAVAVPKMKTHIFPAPTPALPLPPPSPTSTSREIQKIAKSPMATATREGGSGGGGSQHKRTASVGAGGGAAAMNHHGRTVSSGSMQGGGGGTDENLQTRSPSKGPSTSRTTPGSASARRAVSVPRGRSSTTPLAVDVSPSMLGVDPNAGLIGAGGVYPKRTYSPTVQRGAQIKDFEMERQKALQRLQEHKAKQKNTEQEELQAKLAKAIKEKKEREDQAANKERRRQEIYALNRLMRFVEECKWRYYESCKKTAAAQGANGRAQTPRPQGSGFGGV